MQVDVDPQAQVQETLENNNELMANVPTEAGSGGGSASGGDGKTIDQRRIDWFNRDGKRQSCSYDYVNASYVGARSYLFAWLENNRHGTCRQNLAGIFNTGAGCYISAYDSNIEVCTDTVNKVERVDLTKSDPTDSYIYNDLDCVVGNIHNMNLSSKWVAPGSHAPLTLTRLYYQYGDKLKSSPYNATSQYNEIGNELGGNATSENSFGLHPNTWGDGDMQPQLAVIRFLWALGNKNATVKYCPGESDQCKEFSYTYNGQKRTYTPGATSIPETNLPITAFLISRDALFLYFDNIANRARTEQDSFTYNMAAVESLRLLYDFADRTNDPDGLAMKKRAKMTLDLIMLDDVLDYSAGQHGGSIGRAYRGNYANGSDTMSWFYDWGLWFDTNDSAAFASSYRLSDSVVSIGLLGGITIGMKTKSITNIPTSLLITTWGEEPMIMSTAVGSFSLRGATVIHLPYGLTMSQGTLSRVQSVIQNAAKAGISIKTPC